MNLFAVCPSETLTTIEYQGEALENANINIEVFKTMGVAAKALKQTHNNMNISKY
jgi:hypothetical protein